jgi:hypothetical protein
MDSLLSDIISLQTVDPQVDGDLSLIEPTLAQMSSTVSVPLNKKCVSSSGLVSLL